MKKTALLTLALAAFTTAQAQKLPNIQPSGKLLPPNIRIDGKLEEWQGTLQAYNKANNIEYTLANNADQLYLAVRSKDAGVTAKILVGGITLEVVTPGQKEANRPSVTFPHNDISFSLTPTGGVKSNFQIVTDSSKIAEKIQQLKLIKVLNLKGVTDTVLSIYNEQAIKTKIAYNNGALVYEMLIPRAYLGLTGGDKFNYKIKLNGAPDVEVKGGPPPPPIAPADNWMPGDPKYISHEVKTPTNFSGQYTFAK